VTDAPKPVGVLLAGGLARRMGGGDKALLPLGGRTLLDHVIARLRPQMRRLVLNANGDPARFARWGLTVVADTVPDRPGPLAGLLAGMTWTRQHCPEATDIVTVPADTPFLPPDLVARLHAARAREGTPIALAASAGRMHPVIGLWPVRLETALAEALARGEWGVGAWALAQGAATADYEVAEFDPFMNVNRPEELAEAERLLRLMPLL
jgi:molybdopterin-guanine dinucleotide biosynthesis protein A